MLKESIVELQFIIVLFAQFDRKVRVKIIVSYEESVVKVLTLGMGKFFTAMYTQDSYFNLMIDVCKDNRKLYLYQNLRSVDPI